MRFVKALGLLILILVSSLASGISIRHDVPEANYLNLAASYDAVGLVDLGEYIGSGTLVSPTQILTAAHNVDDNNDGVPDMTTGISFLLGDNVDTPDHSLSVSAITISPQWATSGGLPQYDLAVLTLSQPFSAIAPMTMSTINPVGMIGTMIGYGANGTGQPPFQDDLDGLRRAAQNRIDIVGNPDPLDGFTIQTDFDSPNSSTDTFGSSAPLALEGTTAGGDSGGPIVVNNQGQEVIVGVLNGGYNLFGDPAEYGDISIWASFLDSDNLAFLNGEGLLVAPITGDFNNDGNVDAADYTVWRDNFAVGAAPQSDYNTWVNHYGDTTSSSAASKAIPEPSTLLMLIGFYAPALRGR